MDDDDYEYTAEDAARRHPDPPNTAQWLGRLDRTVTMLVFVVGFLALCILLMGIALVTA